ncbi:hypothetical protein PV10_05760 [Exophiala mesophila]|uniref:ubiquitinyl hydrolase 1 n=1 Tax=Exophiala mesophila TaxID=212818 RepID=A0A0D1XSS8_EXOME|nr:uncharacterized protein PV10_05760 [Exophiala mesophila]KIV91196.1 hypothetical protein PV10_05760 [Exophiala mesophila]
MTGINRFLSKREGKRDRDGDNSHSHASAPANSSSNSLSYSHSVRHSHSPHRFLSSGKKSESSAPSPANVPKPVDPNSAADFYGLFDARGNSADILEEQKMKTLRQRLMKSKGVNIRDAQILWALRSTNTNGDVDSTYALLLAMSDASEGILTPFDPRTKLLGAQNRHAVTCYLDSTLFSMFSRLDSFEAMLYNSFPDVSRNKLAFVIRLWVNLLRSGRLITTDITEVLQKVIAECGWTEAGDLHQQDASEAFTFITGKLELPLMTLKMDIFHTGKEDATDDHKFVNERLLEVAIPQEWADSNKEITLEECLEEYFNNRIEVRRHMERRSTMNSIRKSNAIHIETVELDSDSSPITPMSSSPSQISPLRPSNRHRAPSIIQERYVPSRNESGFTSLATINSKDSTGRPRAGSVRKEVMMPAWQFFSLIPWYTDNAPTNDAQVAAHFSTKRPVLGLCLKRYSFTPAGKAIRLDTKIDIPVEIGVPHFIQDDHVEEIGALHGVFKLSLQSVVCHRGNSVDSGHYIALVRGTAPPSTSDSSFAPDHTKTWMRFDDLAPNRITMVDIEKALKEETPYLLFYQIMPTDGDPSNITAGETSLASAADNNYSLSELSTTSTLTNPSEDSKVAQSQLSLEIPFRQNGRGRSPTGERRTSVVSFTDLPPEYSSEKLSVPADSGTARSSSPGLSASQNKSNEGGLGRRLSKLARRSREVLPADLAPKMEVHVTPVGDGLGSRRSSLQMPSNSNNAASHQTHGDSHKHHKREKSRGRLSRSKVRADGQKPDRECTIM